MPEGTNPAGVAGLSSGSQMVLSTVIGIAGGLAIYLAYVIIRFILKTVSWIASRSSALFSGPPASKSSAPKGPKSNAAAAPAHGSAAEPQKSKHTMSLRQAKEAAKKHGGKGAKPQKHSHALFLGTLQGHQDSVTGCAVSSDSKLVATSSEDRVLRVFALDTAVRGPKHSSTPNVKINLTKTPMGVCFGNSNEQLIACTAGLLGHASLSMHTKANGPEPVWELADCLSKKTALPGGLAYGYRMVQGPGAASPTAGFPVIAMGAGGGSTELRLFSTHHQGGRELERLDSGQMKNYMMAVSQDGRFVSVGAFTAEMKIWEVRHSREGTFTGVDMILGLKGHTSQVKCVGFSSDSKKAYTASLDGSLGIWNIDVRYHLKEDAKRIVKVALPLPKGQCYDLLAVAPDSSGGCIAASHGSTLHFLCPKTGALLDTVSDAHASGIVQMVWTRDPVETEKGRQAVLVTAGKDNNVRLWGCPTA